jgi:hypothetical protein
MSNIFTMLPFVVADNSLPVIPVEDYVRLRKLEEAGAYDHWIFGGDAASLVGKIGENLFTAQSDAPIFMSSYLSISGAEGKALLSPLGEDEDQADTIAVVFRHSHTGSGVVVPFGSIGKSSDPPPTSGGSPFRAGASLCFLTYRGAINSIEVPGVTIPENQWLFLCVSRRMTADGRVRLLRGGSEIVSLAGDYSGYTPAAAGRKIALGSAYFTSNAAHTIDFAEAVIFNRELAEDEIEGVYTRAKERMAARGITVI